MKNWQKFWRLALFYCCSVTAADITAAQAVKVTTLSTMLADAGLGEWGYAALVEVDGRRILFDSGASTDVVLKNAKTLDIDLSTVEDVVISHFHGDHTGGLLTLRQTLLATNPKALSRLHVGAGILTPRFNLQHQQRNSFIDLASAYRATGGQIIEHAAPSQILPGVWFSGPVARKYDETNWNPGLLVQRDGKYVADNLSEDSSLFIPTKDGTVIVTGCGHAGIMNIADAAKQVTKSAGLLAVIGGIHLYAKPDPVLVRTAQHLAGLRYLVGGHCTGIEALFRLRELLGLSRKTAVVESVGTSFTLGSGIKPGDIAGWVGPDR
ncbi:MBL fold metallo-hydrolase [Rheinheimera texasensis]|uniref:MBL fold metallo-hydrolase n=1 Tax=Rheinheimera texasensis TaxID=306205 RepID=UPI0032B1D770